MDGKVAPLALPGTHFIDIRPDGGGAPFRIFLSIPRGAPPVGGWPLLVQTDGNATFPFASACLATQAPHTEQTNVGWGVIAAIGYPTDEPYDMVRRSWDLSPPPGCSYPPFVSGGPEVRTGGAARLLDFIEHTLLPWLGERTPLDPTRRTLFGHSFGGLFTLYALFHRPDLFDHWVAASPSIFWEDKVILRSEADRALASGKAPRLHLSAGALEGPELTPFEEQRADAADRLAAKQRAQTLALAEDMAHRLDGAPDGLCATFECFAGETHMSVLAPAINRAIAIAFESR